MGFGEAMNRVHALGRALGGRLKTVAPNKQVACTDRFRGSLALLRLECARTRAFVEGARVCLSIPEPRHAGDGQLPARFPHHPRPALPQSIKTLHKSGGKRRARGEQVIRRPEPRIRTTYFVPIWHGVEQTRGDMR